MKSSFCAAALIAALLQADAAKSNLLGLGNSSEGYYQLDTTSIEGAGTKAATAWVSIVQSPTSEARKLGVEIMLVMFILDCSSKTIQPLAWRAMSREGKLIAEGVHGKEKLRTPQADSMDARIFRTVCTWPKAKN